MLEYLKNVDESLREVCIYVFVSKDKGKNPEFLGAQNGIVKKKMYINLQRKKEKKMCISNKKREINSLQKG